MPMTCIRHLPLALLAFLPCSSDAAGGAFEINQDCAAAGCFAGDGAGFPITISTPGSYVLTSDIVVTTAGADAIDVTVSPVDIDLNHHTISGGGSCSGTPAFTCGAGAGYIGINQSNGGQPAVFHVHDGTIRGFTHTPPSTPAAIYLDQPGETLLERLTITENGGVEAISVSSAASGTVRLRDAQISRNPFWGVSTASALSAAAMTLIVENCDFSGNGFIGITNFSAATVTGSRFNNNGNLAISNGTATTPVIALGGNSFHGNNGGGAATQYTISTVRDMGGNTCTDHSAGSCP